LRGSRYATCDRAKQAAGMRIPMSNLWKKIDPDVIWMAPSLMLMSFQIVIAGRNYVSLDAELIIIYFVFGLIIIGALVGLLKPIQKRIDRGEITELSVLKLKKLNFSVLALLIGVNLVSILSTLVN
jgi:hypothetical protein